MNSLIWISPPPPPRDQRKCVGMSNVFISLMHDMSGAIIKYFVNVKMKLVHMCKEAARFQNQARENLM